MQKVLAHAYINDTTYENKNQQHVMLLENVAVFLINGL